ncbi:hypothetical protein [Pseudonocardia sp. HH130630-07]|uniref:hypothetical protein n=1 Tax=Pseudonocardia sp. HH130630-07 TaxID=1690815 RepID=UPI0008150149|nr:hypothetical protein [Pseudonocardia sp. HH130630-07]ANY05561.1 hypothetical protein AFB00_03730 [Pseudonocardia sp. HH130630-07]
MRDIPVVLDGYKITVVEPPAPKVRQDANGAEVPVTDRDGVMQFVVSVFAKLQVQPGQRAPKGEEIKVTLETDPGEGFPEDARVALVEPRINPYSIDSGDGRTISGVAFKAKALRPMHPAPARRGKDGEGE